LFIPQKELHMSALPDVRELFALSDLMLRTAGLNLVTTLVVVKDDDILQSKTGWSGGKPEQESRAPMIGPMKAIEVYLEMLETGRDFVMTPTTRALEHYKFMGGVGQRVHPDYAYIASGSAWDQRCDALWALMLLYAMQHEVMLHHVGFRHSSMEKTLSAIAADQYRHNGWSVEKNVSGQMRSYLKIEVPDAPVYYVEHQYFYPKASGYTTQLAQEAIHWDLVTPDPVGFLNFVAEKLGTQATFWDDAGENDPVGVIWEQNRDGVHYGFMARSQWWEI